jgi:hypothetical protein
MQSQKVNVDSTVVKEQIITIDLHALEVQEGVDTVRVVLQTPLRRPRSIVYNALDFRQAQGVFI